jgi:PiT family inorganic phosphate transporter
MATAPAPSSNPSLLDSKMSKRPGRISLVLFSLVVIAGVSYAAMQLLSDLSVVHNATVLPYVLLGVALLIALGFEFVNGFHDTANAVATSIYTHAMEPNIAVMWSGGWNFIGVMVSSGAVAFGIISLLPVELILQVGSSAGFAMVFALLVAAIIWNLGTWWFGLPSSSSHTLIGSVIGVGLANQLMSVKSATSGVDWSQAANVGKSLLISPIVGFVAAGMLLMLMKALIRVPALYKAPAGNQPPPFWIRCLLILTCGGVSFAHGSNDGQKGMGLIMLILIGTVPTAYALNRAMTTTEVQDFVAVSHQTMSVLNHYIVESGTGAAAIGDPHDEVESYVRTHQFAPGTMLALREMTGDTANQVQYYKSLKNVPPNLTRNIRNDMYLVSESLRLIQKSGNPKLSAADQAVLKNYKRHLDGAIKFIPTWVKVCVALALGMGTMVGWKRIVVTVGEKIGKDHLTYGQGAAAEITAMVTIGAADMFGLPVSTTHVLSSGVAGTMAANGSGLQWGTVRSMAMAWILTLPVSITLSGVLYWVFRRIGG